MNFRSSTTRFFLFAFSILELSGPLTAHAESFSIPNFLTVRPGIFRGGRPGPDDLKSLAAHGVKTVINLQGSDSLPGMTTLIQYYEPGERQSAILAENRLVRALGMQFANLPFNSLQPIFSDDAARVSEAVKMITDPANQPVFLHCEHGVDRTGLVVALERVMVEHWTPARAHEEWVRLGHSGWFNHLFTGNLDTYFSRATTLTR